MDDKRIIELEIKIAHQDKIIEDLSDALYQQQIRIDKLEKSLEDFKKRIQSEGENEIRPNEKPPHY